VKNRGQKEKNHKVFRFGCLPESRGLSAQQAAKPRPLSPTVRRRFSQTFAALWINAGGRLVSSRSRRQEKGPLSGEAGLGGEKKNSSYFFFFFGFFLVGMASSSPLQGSV